MCNIVGVVITNNEASKEEREEFVCHVLMIADEREEVKRQWTVRDLVRSLVLRSSSLHTLPIVALQSNESSRQLVGCSYC